jgi:hypothetical protein
MAKLNDFANEEENKLSKLQVSDVFKDRVKQLQTISMMHTVLN